MELGDHLLGLASRSSPLVRENLRRYGDAPLSEVLAMLHSGHIEPVQPRDDLWAVIGEHASAHYGPEAAQDAVAELRATLLLPTSNHFGVDTFADSVQGTLLFSLRAGTGADRPRTVVVLGFGSISLNNLTYPMGLRLYDPKGGDISVLPQRLPVFPNRVKHCAVGAVGPFDADMVSRARRRLRRMHIDGDATAFCERAAGEILDEDFAGPATLSQPSYGRQSTRINASLWRRLFRAGPPASRLVQLQIEPICTALLSKDLYDPASLIHALFFAPQVRQTLLTGLDGARACWRRDQLQRRLHGPTPGSEGGDGTVFFWGLTEDRRRVPLTLDESGGSPRLAGVDARGRTWTVDFSPDGIASALRAGQLLPSLFTCFAVLAFARGLACVGGYYQVEYLPVMQRGILAALAAGGDFGPAAELVAQVPTDLCVAGMQPVVRVLPDGAVVPAGPVEIAGAGGLTETDLASLQAVSVRDAYLVAFTELFHHLVPDAALPADWVHRLAAENAHRRQLVRLEEG
jgi:hypothetical protein